MPNLFLSRQGRPLMRYPLSAGKTRIGRDPSSDIQLLDEDISRNHCEIEYVGSGYTLTSRGKNGTIVRGQEVFMHNLKNGDILKIGPWEIRYSEAHTQSETETVVKEARLTKILNYDEAEKRLKLKGLKFKITAPNGNGRLEELTQAQISIGSEKDNDLVIEDDPYVSKRHCLLTFDDLRLIIRDIGSRNGTFIDGKRICESAIPSKGAFVIGKTEIKYESIEIEEEIEALTSTQFGGMLGGSESMREIFGLIERISKSEATVCITGESGTGKELVARSIHNNSPRASRPFVALNCGALPANIVESELFGHEKGAFTGASALHQGVFEQADGGTLLLDEIGEMPHDLQTRLLRVLETKQVRRVGGHMDTPVDVRIIAATNRDLKKLVSDGLFREDIFFRLYIVPIHLPPLRERKEDIEILANHFLNEFTSDQTSKTLSEGAINKLISYNWPGNIRELKNTIQRAILYPHDATILAKDIILTELDLREGPASLSLGGQEKDVITRALTQFNGNIRKTSQALKISRTTLASKIKKYNINLQVIKVIR